MRYFALLFLVALGGGFLVVNASAVIPPVTKDSPKTELVCTFDEFDRVESVTARSWSVIDISSGDVIAVHQPDLVLPFASVVKLITAHVTLQQADVFSRRTILTTADISTEGRAGNLAVGQEYVPHELLFPLLLTSSNDAGAALARVYPNLLTEMQEFVTAVGATDTTIADSTGLSNKNRTTTKDLSLIVRSLYQESPHIFDITRTPQIISGYENGWVNNIPFRSLDGYEGGKQGYTPEALQTGVAAFSLNESPSSTIGIALLGSTALANDMKLIHNAITQSYHCQAF